MTTVPTLDAARAAAAAVLDPEVPVLTIDDLGVLRDVLLGDDGAVEVVITPTYSGCPAMDAITTDVRAAVQRAGFADVRVRTVLSPAWTTDWMSRDGRRKLAEYGIAPPAEHPSAPHSPGPHSTAPPSSSPRSSGPHLSSLPSTGPVPLTLGVRCPQCGSPDTRELSRFGSTACKSLWRCRSCQEPFDHFKTI